MLPSVKCIRLVTPVSKTACTMSGARVGFQVGDSFGLGNQAYELSTMRRNKVAGRSSQNGEPPISVNSLSSSDVHDTVEEHKT
jgi:hypothetical protein